jgi:hypothetical protein
VNNLRNPLQFEDLSGRERLALTWAFWWRGLIVSACSMAGGGIAGYLLVTLWQVLRHAFGIVVAPDMVMPIGKTIGGAGGLIVGLFFLGLYIRWLFGARLAGFRLRLERVVEDVV